MQVLSSEICKIFKNTYFEEFERLLLYLPEADLRARFPPPPYFLKSLVYCNHFEELQTKLIEVELIINNSRLIYVYQILSKHV